jgi:hypothetical protein
MNFIYDILPLSGEIAAKLTIGDQKEQQNFIFTEFQRGLLSLQNQSASLLKNGYIVCSHPMIFGFTKMRIFDEIKANDTLDVPLFMRASLM